MSTTVGVELDYYGSPQPHPKQLSVELILEIIAVVASPLVAPDTDTTVRSDPEELVRFESSTEYRAFRTLTAASLVSRTWNVLCRPHIFRTLFISTKNPIARRTFLHFSAPHLAEHIRVLRLWWNHNHPDLRDRHTLNMGWVPSCFPRLTNLQELYLGQWFGRRVVPPAPLTVGMSSIFSAPLRKLVLRGWGFSGKSYLPAFNVLAHILEDLRLDKIVTDEIELPAPPDHIRLEALRNLELRDIDHPVLRCPNFIECPNLKRFTARWTRSEPWCVPTWVPANLPELVLEAMAECPVPEFRSAIRPAIVTLKFSGYIVYADAFAWIRDCVNRLPFPKLVEELTVNITTISDPYFPDGPADDDPTGGLCPQMSDYEVLSHCLQQLREEGALKAVVLDIRMEVDFSEININIEGDPNLVDEPREQAKLEAGFKPLVQANVLDADFTLMQECENEGTITPRGVMHCSVRRV